MTEAEQDDALEKGIEEALNEKISEAAREIGKPLSFRRAENSGQQVFDIRSLTNMAARLLKQKLDERMALVSTYERQRTELIDSYRVRMEHMKIEGEEQLQTLEEMHLAKFEALEKLISKLRMLREA